MHKLAKLYSSTINPIFRKLQQFILNLGVFLLGLMAIVASLQIINRFVEFPIMMIWTEPISKYLLILWTIIGIPYAVRTEDHISVRPLFRTIPERVSRGLLVIANIAHIIFFIFFGYAGYLVAQRQLYVTVPGVPEAISQVIRVGYVHVVIVLISILSIIYIIEQTIKLFSDYEYFDWVVGLEDSVGDIEVLAEETFDLDMVKGESDE